MRYSAAKLTLPTTAVALAAAAVVLLVYLPVGRVLGEIDSLTGVIEFVTDGYYRGVAAFSIWQALLSTVAALVLGLPGAYLVARYRFPGRRLLRAASTVPFVLPSVIAVLGFVLFWGNNGYVNRVLGWVIGTDEPVIRVLYSLRGIVLAHAFYNFPIALRIVGARWERLDQDQPLAARSLGASPTRAFFTITAPRLLPALAAAASLIFLFCFTSFAVILVLGGGPQTTTLEVEVYRLARMSVDLAGASRVAVVQAVLSASIIALYLWAQGSPTPLIGAAGDEGTRFEKLGSPSRRIVLVGAAYAAILGLVVAGPIVAVIVRSLVESSSWAGEFEFSLQHYRNLFTGGELGRSIGNSLVVGLSAAGIATILGSMYAWGLSKLSGKARSALELFAVLPLGISPVVLGLGYFYLGRTISWIPDILAIALVHSTLGFPFVVRTLSSGFASVPGSVVWAARGLGAGRFDVFRTIELPMVRRAVTAAAGFAFALSLGELNAAIMLSTGRVVTLPVAMYRLVAAYRFSSACALGTVLMGVALSVFVAFEGRRPSRRPQ